MTGVIHKDVLLVGCQYGDDTGFRTVTYSLEVSMNNIVRVEVPETLGDV
jgi:hypothetical protein